MTKKNHIQRVHIWDDPESRINFLETTLRDKEWEAVIYEPTPDGSAGRLPEIKTKLDKKGYKTNIGQDEKGNATLTIRHFGIETGLLKSVNELGLVKGVSHSFDNIGTKFSNLMSTGKKVLSHYTENKMKFIGLIYLFGDIVMMGTGLFDTGGKDEDKTPNIERALKSGYGALGATQSLIFMNFAAEADQQLSKELTRKFTNADKKGLILEPSKDWLQAKDPRTKSQNFMEKNAIAVGSVTQIVGRLLWICSGYLQNKRDPSSNGINRMKDGVFSITGWLLMMMKGEKKEGVTAIDIAKKNPLKLISYYSNQLAGIFNAWSTYEGIKGAHQENKKVAEENAKKLLEAQKSGTKAQITEKKGAMVELAGNVTYAIGDATVFLTRTADYDEKSATHPKTLAKVATGFLAEMPLAIGHKKKLEMMESVSNYLATRSIEINSKKQKIANPEQEAQKLAAEIYNEVTMQLPEKDIGLWPIIQKVINASQYTASNQQDKFLQNMAEYLDTVPNILADKAEISELIQNARAKQKITCKETENSKELNKSLTKLVESIPGVSHSPETIMEIYNLSRDTTRTQKDCIEKNPSAESKYKKIAKKPHPRINQSAETGVGSSLT